MVDTWYPSCGFMSLYKEVLFFYLSHLKSAWREGAKGGVEELPRGKFSLFIFLRMFLCMFFVFFVFFVLG